MDNSENAILNINILKKKKIFFIIKNVLTLVSSDLN